MPGEATQYAMLKRLELGADDFRAIQQRCVEVGIEFLSSPFDEEAADLLAELGVETLKIPSGEITNLPLLRHVGALGKRVILSTGMSWLGEVETAVRTLDEAGVGELTLLHCVTEYPAPPEQANLRAMATLAQAFGRPVGYSDHTLGTRDVDRRRRPRRRVIEKHFTLDTTLPGPDHAASLAPPTSNGWSRRSGHVEAGLGRRRETAGTLRGAEPDRRPQEPGGRARPERGHGAHRRGPDRQATRLRSLAVRAGTRSSAGRLARDVRADEALDWRDLG